MTLEEVLRLAVLQRAGAKVVAGAGQLDRPVRWAHSAEPMDIARFLRPGDLLLTTGIELARHTRALRGFIAALDQAGAAGLVVELGRAFDRLPGDLVDEARLRRLPLVALQRETRYAEVTEEIHRAIVNHQYELLAKAERIGREFTELVTREAGLRAILERTASIASNPVVLEDTAHQVVELALHGRPTDELLRNWERHSRSDHIGEGVDRGRACVAAPVWVSGEIWGTIHLLAWSTPIDDVDRLALDRAAAAVATVLLIQAHDLRHTVNARSTFLADVLQGRYESADELARRARSLGTELNDRPLVALVATLVGTGGEGDGPVTTARVRAPTMVAGRRRSEEGRQALIDQVVDETAAAAASLGVPALVGREGDRVVAVLAVRPPDGHAGTGEDRRSPGTLPRSPTAEAARAHGDRGTGVAGGDHGAGAGPALAVAGDLVSRASARLGGLPVVVGLSDAVTTLDGLRQAFGRADEALRYGLSTGTRAGVHSWSDLGLHHLLVRLGEGPDLARFVEAELGPLLRHDAGRGVPLLPTLRAALVAGGSKTRAAQELGVRRRTVYDRLGRIEALLGRSIDDHDARTRLAVALQGLDVLRSRPLRAE